MPFNEIPGHQSADAQSGRLIGSSTLRRSKLGRTDDPLDVARARPDCGRKHASQQGVIIRTKSFMLLTLLATFWLLIGFFSANLALAGADSDGDGLSNSQEIQIGTDPSNADTDGDGLKDGWEVNQLVPAMAAGNPEPVEIPQADPLRKDIFVEVDWMVDPANPTHFEFREAARKRVEDAFNRAPDDGVNIHIDAGDLGGGGDKLPYVPVLAFGTDYLEEEGVGDKGQGAGIAIGNIDNDPRPDIVVMAYANPAGANSFRYRIGWNIDKQGIPTSWSGAPMTPWSDIIEVDGVGDEGEGAGIRLIDLDGNGRPELILMAYDNPAGANSFRYRVGMDLDTSGHAASWGGVVEVSGVGWEGQGAGLAFTNLDNDPRPEMVLMAYDNPTTPKENSFRYRIGWNVDASGVPTFWSGFQQVDGVGWEGQGADVDFVDIDGNGRPEMILMAYDHPTGKPNNFRYRIGWNLNTDGATDDWSDYITYPADKHSVEGEGAGLAVADIDTNGQPDLLLLSYGVPSDTNKPMFRYKIAYDLDSTGQAFYYERYKTDFFSPSRAGIFHYAIFANLYWKGGTSSGLSTSNRDFIVTLGGFAGTDNEQSGAFMHELGHNLGLDHGGNSGTNYKPNYPSVMNYGQNDFAVDVDYDGLSDGPLDYSHGFLPDLDENCLDEEYGIARFVTTEGVGWEGQGADLANWDLDGNGIQDLVLLAYDAPSAAPPNNIRYKIGYDVTARGVPRRWTNGYVQLPGMGDEGQGAGVELVDLNGNGRPEMIVMVIDNPSGQNNLRYRIGFDLDDRGETTNWGDTQIVDGMGSEESQGLGIAAGNIDADPRPDLVVAIYDNPSGQNNFRYKIAWNLGSDGTVSSWSGVTEVDGVGWEGQGAGVALTNLDADPRPEMLLMAYDNPQGPNTFRVKIGWNLAMTTDHVEEAIATNWSEFTSYPGVGNEAQGAGIRLFDANGNGHPEMFLLAYDNPPGANTFRIAIGQDVTAAGNLGGPFGFPRDWNGKGGAVDTCVMENVNNDKDKNGKPIFGVLTDWNDWDHLVY